jgi:hypothetical protein
MTVYTEPMRGWISAASLSALLLDPDLASVLLAFAFAGALGLPALRKAVRRGGRFCESCGRRILLGQRTCDCDH